MAGIQLTGLASGFDWKSLVDSLMDLERTPAVRMETERTQNDKKLSVLQSLGTRLTDLKTASTALSAAGLFTGRSAASSNSASTWSSSASASAAIGSYTFNVQTLATSAHRDGAGDIGSGIASSSDVSGVTLATMSTATPVTAGNFTINGKLVTIALTDSLQNVFDKISTATGNAVTASYDAGTDKISLASSSEIVLGAANDSSNFLAISRLSNNGTGAVTSASNLGSTSLSAPLASARLRNAITAVDGSGNGTFAVNGVSLSYNVNTDSLSTILNRITTSSAGVTATYDSFADRVVLTNKTTGDTGVAVSDDAGGLMSALGQNTGAALVRGKNALFTINGGATLTSTSNTFDASVHGIAGLSVTARTETAETIDVSANTGAMRTAIDSFISKFNSIQTYIDDQTKVTSTNGKVTAALLSDNREVQEWARTMRSMAFAAVGGITGSIGRLEDLGIDFMSSSSQLTIKDSTKLDNALKNKSGDVDAFFNKASTGFVAKFDTFFTSTIGFAGTGGNLGSQTTLLTKSSSSLTDQIAALDRRLAQKRQQLEASFIAMETAQSKMQQMQTQLTNAFSSK